MNIYLDIDGVLLTDSLSNRSVPAFHSLELLKFLTDNHTVYWLTTHCHGGENHAPEYLYPKFPPEAKQYIDKILPTDWGSWKTDAIDFSQDFRWIDDDVYEPEREKLRDQNCLLKLIEVNLTNNPDQLLSIIISLGSHKNPACPHNLQSKVMIGYKSTEDTLLYEMYACQNCGKYIDKLGNLDNFEKEVEIEYGVNWKWEQEYMTPEELTSWQPEKNTRIVTINPI